MGKIVAAIATAVVALAGFGTVAVKAWSAKDDAKAEMSPRTRGARRGASSLQADGGAAPLGTGVPVQGADAESAGLRRRASQPDGGAHSGPEGDQRAGRTAAD